MYQKYIKRTLDHTFAFTLLILTAPLFIMVAIAIKVDSPGPIIFKQKRYGRKNSIFMIYKFRTMTIDAPSGRATNEFHDSQTYITKPGRIIRKLSIDELPQIINVLRGEMSIVGPRPVVLSEKSLTHLRNRNGANTLRPGITGWAQINGRDELDDAAKAKMDGYYVEHLSFAIDMKCALKTLAVIFSAAGHAEGHQQRISHQDEKIPATE